MIFLYFHKFTLLLFKYPLLTRWKTMNFDYFEIHFLSGSVHLAELLHLRQNHPLFQKILKIKINNYYKSERITRNGMNFLCKKIVLRKMFSLNHKTSTWTIHCLSNLYADICFQRHDKCNHASWFYIPIKKNSSLTPTGCSVWFQSIGVCPCEFNRLIVARSHINWSEKFKSIQSVSDFGTESEYLHCHWLNAEFSV